MTEVARSVASPVRHRNVTWQDPLIGAALARGLSGLEYLLAIAEGRIPPPPIAALLGMSMVNLVFEPRPAQAQVPADRPAENGHGR
jgi:hypothetical protein